MENNTKAYKMGLAAMILVVAVIMVLMVDFWLSCKGKTVRGLFWLECIEQPAPASVRVWSDDEFMHMNNSR
jgi:hypothetical protein